MRNRIAILSAKLIKFGLTILNRRGGSLPGKIALKIAPNILASLTYPENVIMITGTNGKTTTTNMVYRVLKSEIPDTISNFNGDNLIAGITTLLLTNTNLSLKVQSSCIVIETDEITVPSILKDVPVKYFLINNLFRDQLDRAGEMETIIRKFEEALKTYSNVLILNGDDPNVARIGYHRENVHYYGVDKNSLSKKDSQEASEGKYCFKCSHLLTYDYYQYSHIGHWHCDNCDFGDFNRLMAANISDDMLHFKVDDYQFKNPYDTLYAIYNCMAVISLARLIGINDDSINQIFNNFKMNDGRMEYFDINRQCLLNLIKNPTGANEVIKYINKDQSAKDLWLVLNDNGQDGRDVSWIYDVDFEQLLAGNVQNIICSGTRAYDMALCIKYSGYQNHLEVYQDQNMALEAFAALNNNGYILVTYTALQATRKLIKRSY